MKSTIGDYFNFCFCSKHSHHRRKRSHLSENNLRSRTALGSELLNEAENEIEDRDVMQMESHRFDPLARQVLHKRQRTVSERPRRYQRHY